MGRGRGRGRGDDRGGRFDNRGGPGGGMGRGPGGRGGYGDNGDMEDSTTFPVPSDKCGLVIGKGTPDLTMGKSFAYVICQNEVCIRTYCGSKALD